MTLFLLENSPTMRARTSFAANSPPRCRYLRPAIERMPWGANQMEVINPFGNRLRFNEAAETGDAVTP